MKKTVYVDSEEFSDFLAGKTLVLRLWTLENMAYINGVEPGKKPKIKKLAFKAFEKGK